jgi:hypothetical protein
MHILYTCSFWKVIRHLPDQPDLLCRLCNNPSHRQEILLWFSTELTWYSMKDRYFKLTNQITLFVTSRIPEDKRMARYLPESRPFLSFWVGGADLHVRIRSQEWASKANSLLVHKCTCIFVYYTCILLLIVLMRDMYNNNNIVQVCCNWSCQIFSPAIPYPSEWGPITEFGPPPTLGSISC